MNIKKPICGTLSVAMPPVGLLVAYVGFTLIHEPSGPHQLAGAGMAILILSLLCPVAGIGIGIAGLVRRERFRWLPVLGLLLNIVTAASYLAA
jgi:hypothetical protein